MATEASEIAHAVCDLDGRFLEVDGAFGELLQMSSNEIFVRNILDVTFAEDQRHNKGLLHELVAHGRAFTIRKRYVRPNGSLVWVRNHVSRTVGARGQSRVAACIRPLPFSESEIATMLEKASRRAKRILHEAQTLRDKLPESARATRRPSTFDEG